MVRRTRRQVLRTVGIGCAVALGGCSGLQGSDGTTGTETTTRPGSPRSETTVTAPGTTTTTRPGDADGETTTPSGDGARQRARKFLSLLGQGEFESAHGLFSSAAAEKLPVARLEKVWTGVERRDGPYRTVTNLTVAASDRGQRVTGTAVFESGRWNVELTFDGRTIAGFWLRPGPSPDLTPPAYVDRAALSETDVTLAATDDCSLGATITMPAGSGTVPGVVLVHGNGAHDRDVSIGPNKPFRDLAWGLASRGVAVLRYDKRTHACDVDLATLSIDEVVTNDALTAIDRLRAHERVADDGVVVAGHSIGATLAPRIAKRDGNLAGAVMLAPLGRSVPDAMVDQTRYLLGRDGTLSSSDKSRLAQVRAVAEQIRTLDIDEGEVVSFGGREYWRTMTAYDRFATARQVDVPLFLAFGGRDWQVTVEADRPRWTEALSGEDAVRVKTYPTLNHLFIPGQGQPTQVEYFDEGHVAKAVVADVATWTKRVAGDPAGATSTTPTPTPE